MSSVANDFGNLSDSEIHEKLKAIGLDIPVVATNRSVCIRKLQSAEGNGTTGSPTNRRKTVGGNTMPSGGITLTPSKKRHSTTAAVASQPQNSVRSMKNSISTNGQEQNDIRASPTLSKKLPSSPPRTKQTTPKPSMNVPNPPVSTVKQTSTTNTSSKESSRTITQKIPFTSSFITLEDDADNDDEVQILEPTQLFTRTRKSTHQYLDINQPPTPPSAEKEKRYASYMKLFNNHAFSSDRHTNLSRRSGVTNYSSDEDDSSDDKSIRRTSTTVSLSPRSTVTRPAQWNKYKEPSAANMPSTPNTLIYLGVAFFVGVLAIYGFNRFQNNNFLGISDSDPHPAIVEKLKYSGPFVLPLCDVEGANSLRCIRSEDVNDVTILFSELREELNQRRYKIECKSPDDEMSTDVLSLSKAKSLLYHLSSLAKSRIDGIFQYLLFTIIENPKMGIIIETEESDATRTQLSKLEQLDKGNLYVTTTSMDKAWYCTIFKVLWNFVSYISIVAGVAFLSYGTFLGYSVYQRQKKQKQMKLWAFVEDILNLLQEHHENSKLTNEDPLAIHHIRDNLIQPADRTPETMKLWSDAIQYILNNESRVREEMHHIKGEEYRVLKWLPPTSPKRPHSAGTGIGGWQGPAFEIVDGSPNSLPPNVSTTCLKVRHMYDASSPLTDDLKSKIEAALRTKAGAELKHIGYDNHNDSCVYIKCRNKEDAKKVFGSLHGWWYDGKLLSVKFLREERYHIRFPEAVA